MPRAGLSEARVVEAAEQLLDEVGLQRLTLTALADQLGVRQPSLYKHIESLDQLIHEISVRAKLEVADVLARASVGRSREDAIRSLSRAYREWALAHPGRYATAQRAPQGDDIEDEVASTSAVQVIFDVLIGFDLSGDDAIDATRAIRATLHGFVTLEAVGGFGLPRDIDNSFERMVNGMNVALAHWSQAAKLD